MLMGVPLFPVNVARSPYSCAIWGPYIYSKYRDGGPHISINTGTGSLK